MDTLQRLHQLLDERGWSEYRLAKNCGLSNSTIANIYHRNTIPSISTLEAICTSFSISLSQFFAEGEMVELTPELKELFDIGRGECGFVQPAIPVGLFHSALAQFAPRVSFGFHTIGAAEHDSPLTGCNRRIRGEASVPCSLRDLMLRKIHHALIFSPESARPLRSVSLTLLTSVTL